MDATQARKDTNRAVRSQRSKAARERQDAEKFYADQRKLGRKNALTVRFPATMSEIKKAVKKGENSITYSWCDVLSSSSSGIKDGDRSFYEALLSKLEVLLRDKGFKVTTRLNTEHYSASGSDPIIFNSFDYLDPIVEISW